MLDAWIIDGIIEHRRRRNRPAVELPLIQLPLYQEQPLDRDDGDDREETEARAPDRDESRRGVIVIDMV